MSTFQDNLKHYRKKAGYSTVKAFTKELDIPYTTYLDYEKGLKGPSSKNIVKIADKLGITTDELLGVMPDYTRYFRQVGYDVEEKEGVLYFASHWEAIEDTPPHSFKLSRKVFDNLMEALENSHRKNVVKVISEIARC